MSDQQASPLTIVIAIVVLLIIFYVAYALTYKDAARTLRSEVGTVSTPQPGMDMPRPEQPQQAPAEAKTNEAGEAEQPTEANGTQNQPQPDTPSQET